MERHEVEAFLVLAEELHFGRAAEHLRLSTARVSQTIRRLERRVGAPLFERTSRTVSLTAVGRQLRADLEPAHALMNAALERAIEAAREVNRVLRVGFLGPTAGDFLLAVARVFGERHADREISLREIRLGDQFGPLRRGEVDLALTKFPVHEPDLTVGPVLLREPKLLALPGRHRLAGRAAVRLEDVADDTFADVVAAVPDYWREAHVPRRTPLGRTLSRGPAVATLNEILLVVAAGQALCAVDVQVARRNARHDISYARLLDAAPFELGFVWRSAAQTALVRDFIREAHDLRHPREPSDRSSSAAGRREP